MIPLLKYISLSFCLLPFFCFLVFPASLFPLSLSASLLLPIPLHFPGTSTSAYPAFPFSPYLHYPSQFSFIYPVSLPILSLASLLCCHPCWKPRLLTIPGGGGGGGVVGGLWCSGPAPRCVCECVVVTRHRQQGGRLGRRRGK